MKPRGILTLFVAVAFILAAALVWTEIRRGFSARAKPSYIETLLASTARRLAVPSSYRQVHNPLPASAENIRGGMEHFASHCAICHGNDGAAETLFGPNMYPKPPDMRRPETQNQTQGELYYTIQNGVRLSGMPAFGEEHGTGDMDTWQLVLFIRQLPRLTSDQLREMERLNPRTEAEREEENEEKKFLSGENPQTKNKKPHRH